MITTPAKTKPVLSKFAAWLGMVFIPAAVWCAVVLIPFPRDPITGRLGQVELLEIVFGGLAFAFIFVFVLYKKFERPNFWASPFGKREKASLVLMQSSAFAFGFLVLQNIEYNEFTFGIIIESIFTGVLFGVFQTYLGFGMMPKPKTPSQP